MEDSMETLDKKKTIKELEKLAAEVLQLKQEREQRRPLLIEFCGSPKSGKSTTITSLNLFLKRNGFNTVVLTERASVCPIDNKTHPFFNIWTLTAAISEIVKHLDLGKDKVDIIISDRGIFDSLCWFEWLNTNPSANAPYLDDKTYEDLRHFILMDMWKSYLDLIYVFRVSPETSIKREYANLLTEKRGSIMQEQVLKGFNTATDSIIHQYEKDFREVIIIETDTADTDKDPNAVSYFVTAAVLKNLRDLLIEKVGYFDGRLKDQLKYGINDISELKKTKLKFDNRDKVEAKDCIQPIAIAVITNPARSKVLVVKKSNKRTSIHSPEKDKLLAYIGGHVRKEDEKTIILKTIEQALHREIQEEIGESISIQHTKPFIIYTPKGKISPKHAAFCYIIEMDLDDKKFKLTSDEFIMKTGTTKSGQILSVREIASGKYETESWTDEIMKEIFNIEMPKSIELF
jgi:predicted NUDIX family phosphoesterase/thymidylate kinase